MRNFLLFCLSIIFYHVSIAQECDKLIQGGLYSFTSMTNTGSFNKDLRTYYLSDQFTKDMHSGKWGASLTVPIKGVPLTLGMEDSQEKYQEFRSKILNETELSIASNFYQTSFSTIPNTNLYDSYVKCIDLSTQKGLSGFFQGLNVETEDAVVFTIYYKPSAPNEPMPKVTNFNVEPAGSVISGALKKGDLLNGFSILVTCRRNPEKDLILSLQTDRGSISSKVSAPDPVSSGKEFPIGTVISSFLNWEQFNLASKNNDKSPGGIWTSQKSKWSPCDGRPVPNSKLAAISSLTNAPDLRGIFLRGVNSIDPSYSLPPQDPSQLNVDPKSVGVYQSDALKNHSHKISNSTDVLRYIEGGPLKGGDGGAFINAINNPNKGGSALLVTDNDGGSLETRPKSMSIYYYIKTN